MDARQSKRAGFTVFVLSAFLTGTGQGAETNVVPSPSPAPRTSFADGTNSLGRFQVKRGFHIELVAAAPLVSSPAAMSFDENGRLFVAEMIDYPDRRSANPHLGRVRMLEDSDADGVFDSSAVFADNLAWPSAVVCYGGGVFVAATPDIIYLKDSNGDGIADVRRVMLSGFGGTNTVQPDVLLNNFSWGLDNRIHGGAAGMGGSVAAINAPGGSSSVELGRSDFCFDPRTLRVFPETGAAQSGLSFDSFGRKFFSELIRPLRCSTYDIHYYARNPFFPRAPDTAEVLTAGAPIFPMAGARAPAGEAALVGSSPGRMISSNNPASWFTMARGCVVYRGSAFPSNYLDSVFIADPAAHLIHRAVVRENGLEVVAARAIDEGATEFVRCSDTSFHPAQLLNGPDGALYIADMQNGGESGRIFRVVPDGFQQPGRVQLRNGKTYDLVATLAHANGWHRDSAARLLYEKHDPAAISLLSNMVNNARMPLARIQALHAMEGMESLTAPVLTRGLRDPDEHVREHAVRLTERAVKDGVLPDPIWNQLKTLVGDPSLRVRYQLAFTLGDIKRGERVGFLNQILRRDLGNPLIETAVFSSLGEGAGDMFISLASDPSFRANAQRASVLSRLATLIGVEARPDHLAQALEFINRTALVDRAALDARHAYALLYAIGDGLHRNRSNLGTIDRQGRLQRFYSQALLSAVDESLPEALRVEAIHAVGVSTYSFADTGDLLLLLYGSGQPASVQLAAIDALSRFNDSRVGASLFSRWQVLDQGLRAAALTGLLGHFTGANTVLTALETGQIRVTDVPVMQVNFLRNHPDASVNQRAIKLFGPFSPQRPAAVQQFGAAVTTAGVAARGRDLFLARCASCHQSGAEGQAIGPDVVNARPGGKAKLLSSILEPSLNISPEFTTYVLNTEEGESLIGLITDQTAATVTLKKASGVEEVWPRANVQMARPQPWSLMPDGLEQGLSVQAMADLLEYLMAGPARPVTGQTSRP